MRFRGAKATGVPQSSKSGEEKWPKHCQRPLNPPKIAGKRGVNAKAVLRMMRAIWAVVIWLCGMGGAVAEQRIALVVGNGAYTTVSGLANPPSDADLMAGTLRGLGFEVTVLRDSTKAAMSRAVADFGSALRAAGPEATGLFYYAGHGVQSFGRNYLLPVDVAISNAADLDLVAVDAESVLRQMASARNKTNIFILDACRNNPFATLPDLGDNGLAEMKAPTGTFLAYATAPREVALDGTDGNSPFTKALAAMMVTQGMPIEQVFKEVRVAVLDATGGRQTPWDTSSLTEDFTFAAAASDEVALWDTVRVSGDPVQIKLFLKAYPDTAFRAEAEVMLAAVMPQAPAGQPEAGEVDPAMVASIAAADVTFAGPIGVGPADIAGQSIEALIEGKPAYSPIPGLPDEAWQGANCAACHQWTKAALCDQGKFYAKDPDLVALETQHPLGGAFKLTLRRWAELGCN
jgi:hypothetical protein